jgi:hypothetical protein
VEHYPSTCALPASCLAEARVPPPSQPHPTPPPERRLRHRSAPTLCHTPTCDEIANPFCPAQIKVYTEALRQCFAEKLGADLLQFERFLVLRGKARSSKPAPRHACVGLTRRLLPPPLPQGGNHAHVNCVAVPRRAAAKAKQEFVSAATAAGFQFQELRPVRTL